MVIRKGRRGGNGEEESQAGSLTLLGTFLRSLCLLPGTRCQFTSLVRRQFGARPWVAASLLLFFSSPLQTSQGGGVAGGWPRTRHSYASHPLRPCPGPSPLLGLFAHLWHRIVWGCSMPKIQEVAEPGGHVCTSRAPDLSLQLPQSLP